MDQGTTQEGPLHAGSATEMAGESSALCLQLCGCSTPGEADRSGPAELSELH